MKIVLARPVTSSTSRWQRGAPGSHQAHANVGRKHRNRIDIETSREMRALSAVGHRLVVNERKCHRAGRRPPIKWASGRRRNRRVEIIVRRRVTSDVFASAALALTAHCGDSKSWEAVSVVLLYSSGDNAYIARAGLSGICKCLPIY